MDLSKLVQQQKKYFRSGKTKNVEERLRRLAHLKQAIKKNEDNIIRALKQDLNKSEFEAYATEIGQVYEEINFVMKHLKKWAKPVSVKTPISQFPSRSFMVYEPYGSVLVIAPWNYPFSLAMAPLVGAIAAGNCVVVKPSEYSVHTSAVIENILEEIFEAYYVAVVQGEVEVSQKLLEEKFDYIFFTGNKTVGKAIMSAAAKHLTPVSLELGGKSPCIVDETAQIKLAAKRIVWGKFLNAGQTCVAPDYVLVHSSVKKQLMEYMIEYINSMYGESPLENSTYPKIITKRHYERLVSLLDHEKVLYGGESNPKTNQIAPTIVDGVTWEHALMADEIFGPILPVLEYETLEKVVEMVTAYEKPLACYFFTTSKKNEKYILSHISYGGGCINDTIVHLATPYMPFGGVGESGMGGYHGKASFTTFSHKKSIMKKSNLIDLPLRYAPYTEVKNKMLKSIMQ